MNLTETEWGVRSYFENIFIEPDERIKTIQLKLLQQVFLLLSESSKKKKLYMVLDKLGRFESLLLTWVGWKIEMSDVGGMWIKGFQFIFYDSARSSK